MTTCACTGGEAWHTSPSSTPQALELAGSRNAGFWLPAWGYDPGADYTYDGPIYAYRDWPPHQMTANVQGTLQHKGYYRGETKRSARVAYECRTRRLPTRPRSV
jgi:hypothetical protein